MDLSKKNSSRSISRVNSYLSRASTPLDDILDVVSSESRADESDDIR